MKLINLGNGLRVWGLTAFDSRLVWKGLDAYLPAVAHLKPGDIVFDVGANTGLFCLWLGRLEIPLTVFAFEPAPLAMDCLLRNAKLCSYVKVRPFRFAIASDSVSRLLRFRPRMSQASSIGSRTDLRDSGVKWALRNHGYLRYLGPVGRLIAMAATRWQLAERAELVQCRPLSEYMAAVGKVDLLKVDVEGYEHEVLTGIEEWGKIGSIIVECHFGEADVRNTMFDHGFTVSRVPNPDFPEMAILTGRKEGIYADSETHGRRANHDRRGHHP